MQARILLVLHSVGTNSSFVKNRYCTHNCKNTFTNCTCAYKSNTKLSEVSCREGRAFSFKSHCKKEDVMQSDRKHLWDRCKIFERKTEEQRLTM